MTEEEYIDEDFDEEWDDDLEDDLEYDEEQDYEHCPICFSDNLLFEGRCTTCLDCLWSKCSL
jgi:hypothetical protein